MVHHDKIDIDISNVVNVSYYLFAGSHLYVSAEGEFDIYQGDKFQRSFGPGIAFGELALLYNTKRLRSIKGKHKGNRRTLENIINKIFTFAITSTTEIFL